MSRPQAFGLGWVLGCCAAATAALLGLIGHETYTQNRRRDARDHKEQTDVFGGAVQPARHGGCRSLRAT